MKIVQTKKAISGIRVVALSQKIITETICSKIFFCKANTLLVHVWLVFLKMQCKASGKLHREKQKLSGFYYFRYT